MKLHIDKKFEIAFFLFLLFFSFASSYDSGWQNWRTKSNYIVCGGTYQKCSNSLLGVDWFQEIPKEHQNSAKYGLICGESQAPFGCLHWGGAAIGKNYPLNNGSYYLLIKSHFDNSGQENGENFQAAISFNFGMGGISGVDLGSGYKTCVFSKKFSADKNSKIWIKGTGNSFNSAQFRVVSCIPNETDIVYCENSQTAVPTCTSQCIPKIVNSSWSSWEMVGCLGNQTQEKRFKVEYDENNCDTFQNKTHYEYRTIGPDYKNTSWSAWSNIGCSVFDLLQSRFLIQYDSLGCAENKTFYETKTLFANLVNTSWSNWENLNCFNSTHRNQTRYRTEYDVNKLGCFLNRTHYEYRVMDDSSCFFGGKMPSINIKSPTNGSFINNSNVFFNVSSDQIVNWTVYINGTIFYTENNSKNTSGNLNLTSGSYNLTVCGSNKNGTSCSSVFFFVNITTINNLPSNLYITIFSPENKTYTNSLIQVNISSNGNLIWYNWNGTNTTYTQQILINFSEGQNLLHAWATNGTSVVHSKVVFYINLSSSKKDNKDDKGQKSSKQNIKKSSGRIEESLEETNKISYTIERLEEEKIQLNEATDKKDNPSYILPLIILLVILIVTLIFLVIIVGKW